MQDAALLFAQPGEARSRCSGFQRWCVFASSTQQTGTVQASRGLLSGSGASMLPLLLLVGSLQAAVLRPAVCCNHLDHDPHRASQPGCSSCCTRNDPGSRTYGRSTMHGYTWYYLPVQG